VVVVPLLSGPIVVRLIDSVKSSLVSVSPSDEGTDEVKSSVDSLSEMPECMMRVPLS